METLNDDSLNLLSEYREIIDDLPMELQRNFTLIRQLDESAQDLMSKVARESMSLCNSEEVVPENEQKRRLAEIGTLLNETVKRGEEKFALAKSIYDAVDRHCSVLDNDLQKFEDEQLIGPSRISRNTSTQETSPLASPTMTSTRGVRSTTKQSDKDQKATRNKPGRKRKLETDQDQDQADYLSKEDALQQAQSAINLSDLPIDPNEPVYCYCRMVSYGEMVACDNDECDIEWFHLSCVGLRSPPKGKWYCKNCVAEVKGKKKL